MHRDLIKSYCVSYNIILKQVNRLSEFVNTVIIYLQELGPITLSRPKWKYHASSLFIFPTPTHHIYIKGEAGPVAGTPKPNIAREGRSRFIRRISHETRVRFGPI